jgi:hypothetical protein
MHEISWSKLKKFTALSTVIHTRGELLKIVIY